MVHFEQNINEGSIVSDTSRKNEIELLNAAWASLEELLENYRDFLRIRAHLPWEKDLNKAVSLNLQIKAILKA